MQVYEVFRREREGGNPCSTPATCSPPTPSWPATTPASSTAAARVGAALDRAPAAILDLDDPDLLQPPFDRSFKKPAGYSTEIKAELAAARSPRRSGRTE